MQSLKDHNELLGTGDEIVKKLKGSPLAAKTVGRLLRNNLDLGHWTRVLESKEWESQNGDHDIMPVLKLSFNYLPFHLQQCFTYCALFPEDYRFSGEELIHFWIGQDVLHSHGENKRIEDIGLSYLTELVGHGFLIKEEDEYEHTRYVIHDLLHELGLKVLAHECLAIYSSNVRSIQIPMAIRHLSINIDDSSIEDRKTNTNAPLPDEALGSDNSQMWGDSRVRCGGAAEGGGNRRSVAALASPITEAAYLVLPRALPPCRFTLRQKWRRPPSSVLSPFLDYSWLPQVPRLLFAVALFFWFPLPNLAAIPLA
ncbi:hypothetical protein PVAP13_2KG191464 [Panicum virgatum]|uniref:Disease resistance protein winged helix domain-containing protein n=1 Tax=Panicum virgatum TaxID=38727 RepID=A0A8T0WB69_PANVG|nr:hypothetical protein PVAP13_2KG191464 [Panicum virgatum]